MAGFSLNWKKFLFEWGTAFWFKQAHITYSYVGYGHPSFHIVQAGI